MMRIGALALVLAGSVAAGQRFVTDGRTVVISVRPCNQIGTQEALHGR
jgi:hypothetical protein